MPDTSVKVFRSTDAGAPSLSGNVGALVGVLDACLVNGYGTVTVNPLVVSGNVATGTVSAGHGFAMLGSTGPVITIAGATPSALNGEWRIASVPNSTTFTFATSGISDQTATGTITAKRSPAGWTKAYSGTNKAAYQGAAPTASGQLLRVDNTYANTNARVRGYEAMTDVDNGTNPFPTVAQVADANYLIAIPGSSTARPWVLVADGLSALWFSDHDSAGYYRPYAFGDIASCIAGDPWVFMVAAVNSGNSTYSLSLLTFSNTNDCWLPRSHDYVAGAPAGCGRLGMLVSYPGRGATQFTYPLPVVAGMATCPITLVNSGLPRGRIRGLFQPLHNLPGSHGDVVASMAGSVATDLYLATIFVNDGDLKGRYAVDIMGPWQ